MHIGHRLMLPIHGMPDVRLQVVAAAANTTLDGLLMDHPDLDVGRIVSAADWADFDAGCVPFF